MARTASINRDTNETKVHVIVSLDGGELEDVPQQNGERTNHHAFQSSKAQYIDIDTGIGFLDHMIHQLAKHGGWSLYVRCRGDLHSMSHSPIKPFDLPGISKQTADSIPT
jgi:imidazoleglycerol-phosphate dehydratase